VIRGEGKLGSKSPLEQFKAFVENPPVIKELVFSINKPLTTTNGTEYYDARWQKDAFFVRQVRSLEYVGSPATAQSVPGLSLTNALPLNPAVPATPSTPINIGFWVGYGDNKAWFVDRQGNLVYFLDNMENYEKVTLGNLPRDCAFELNLLSQVIHMGVPDLAIGSIKWSGNSFEAFSKKTRSKVSGKLEASNGVPLKLRFVIDPQEHSENKPGNAREFVAEYSYSADLGLSYIPNKIAVRIRLLDKATLFSEIQLYRLETSREPINSSTDVATSLILPSARIFHVRKDGVYESKNGEMIKTYDNAYAARFDPKEVEKLFYYVSVGLFTAIALLFLIRRKLSHEANGRSANS
jgi:hypothetical protein